MERHSDGEEWKVSFLVVGVARHPGDFGFDSPEKFAARGAGHLLTIRAKVLLVLEGLLSV